MIPTAIFSVYTLITAPAALPQPPNSLMPVPQLVVRKPGQLELTQPFAIEVTPPVDAASGAELSDARVSLAVDGLRQRLAECSHHDVCLSPCPKPVRLTISWDTAAPHPQSVQDSEIYNLDIGATHAALHAQGPLGVLRGIETLYQWLDTVSHRPTLPAVHIHDAPRFAWRGLSFDSARHFMPVATIKRNLDAMAAVKLNVLHWHLSDDQGFRIESHTFPELVQHGSDGEYYTQLEVKDIVDYAAKRGIRVVPEFDMPGHTSSWFLSHPELSSAEGPFSPVTSWTIFDGALNPARQTTYDFVDKLLAEMTTLFPDAYVHIGGDEVTGNAWRSNPEIVAFMQAHNLADAPALQAYFIDRVAKLVRAHGKKVVGWDEILQPGLAKGTVVQSWQGPQGIRQSLDAGYATILSHGWYLSGSAAAHYLNDPAAGLDSQSAQNPNILGGEACMWSELLTPDLVEAYIWPRTAAVAERLWSSAQVRDVADMYRRLAVQSSRLAALGVQHRGYQKRRFIELAQTPDVAPLEMLASVLESHRENWWPEFRQKRALDNFSDALYAESDRARQLEAAITALVATPQDAAIAHIIEQELQALRDNGPAVAGMLLASAALAPIAPVAALVLDMSQIGLQALHAVQKGRLLSPVWGAKARAVLADSRNKTLGIYVALDTGVAKLVDAASPKAAEIK